MRSILLNDRMHRTTKNQMWEIRMSDLMNGQWKRGQTEWPKLPLQQVTTSTTYTTRLANFVSLPTRFPSLARSCQALLQ